MKNRKLFVLYDGRAKFGNTDDASVMSSTHSEESARKEGKKDWIDYDAIWYEYDVINKNELVNEQIRWDIPPNNVNKFKF